MRRLTSLATSVAVVVGLATALAACGGGSSSSSTTTTTSGATSTSAATTSTSAAATSGSVTIKNFAFQPATTTVKAGSTITVTNQDNTTHTFTADNNAFDTGSIDAGTSKSLTAPSSPGSYPYHCTIHPFMHGRLIVTS